MAEAKIVAEGVYVPNTEPRVYKYRCECCFGDLHEMTETLPPPVLCGACRYAIQKIADEDRMATAREYVNEHGLPEGVTAKDGRVHFGFVPCGGGISRRIEIVD